MEEWRDIIGFEGAYQVSDLGNVRSLDRKVKSRNAFIKVRGKVLSTEVDSSKYICVNLCKNGKKYPRRVHRLVAQAFLPNPNNYSVVNHLDENKLNNNVENLEWCTQKHNIAYSRKRSHNLDSIKISPFKIRIALANTGKKLTSIAKDGNISIHTINCCMKRGYAKAETVGKIAKALGVPVEKLVDMEGGEAKKNEC
ncbi:MAG: NUMOD4 motif-containing HNH endonuclease [Ruminococcus flavefaciens]|nr:NUMOD4 motif-containing HNH endonuclease [Ruminococcus flavefaciens]